MGLRRGGLSWGAVLLLGRGAQPGIWSTRAAECSSTYPAASPATDTARLQSPRSTDNRPACTKCLEVVTGVTHGSWCHSMH
eukprot:COSAG01_NODE_2223_length_8136_cov_10.727917_8_plen_81_part_00